MFICIFKRIKQVVKNMSKYVGNCIKNIINSKFVNGIIKPLAGEYELIHVVGGISIKEIENIQNNGNTLGTLLTDIGNYKNIIRSIDNYYEHSLFVCRQFQGLIISGKIDDKIINTPTQLENVKRIFDYLR